MAKGNIKTYQSDPQYFDNRAVYHDDPRYNDLIRKQIYAGTHGYNPETEELVKLDEAVNVPTYTQVRSKPYYTKPEETPWWEDPNYTPTEQEIKDFVKMGTKQAMLNTPFNMAAAFTPYGAVASSMKGFADAALEAEKGNYGTAALYAGLESLPLVGHMAAGSPRVMDHLYGLRKGMKEWYSDPKSTRTLSEIFPITDAQKAKAFIAQDKAAKEADAFMHQYLYGTPPNTIGNYEMHPSIINKMENIIGDPVHYQSLQYRPELPRYLARRDIPLYNIPKDMAALNPAAIKGSPVNPFSYTEDLLINTRKGEPYLFKNPETQLPGRMGRGQGKELATTEKRLQDMSERIQAHRKGSLGVNFGNEGLSTTFRNKGLYSVNPDDIYTTRIHETGHTMQDVGGKQWETTGGQDPAWDMMLQEITPSTQSWGQYTSKWDPEYGYYIPNKDTPIGRKFADAMVEPKKINKGERYDSSTWRSSPNELHSELMAAKGLAYKKLVQQGVPSRKAMSVVRDPNNDEMLDWLIRNGNLNKHFKAGTDNETKKELIKLLPAMTGVGLGVGAATGDTNYYKMGGKIQTGLPRGAFGLGQLGNIAGIGNTLGGFLPQGQESGAGATWDQIRGIATMIPGPQRKFFELFNKIGNFGENVLGLPEFFDPVGEQLDNLAEGDMEGFLKGMLMPHIGNIIDNEEEQKKRGGITGLLTNNLNINKYGSNMANSRLKRQAFDWGSVDWGSMAQMTPAVLQGIGSLGTLANQNSGGKGGGPLSMIKKLLDPAGIFTGEPLRDTLLDRVRGTRGRRNEPDYFTYPMYPPMDYGYQMPPQGYYGPRNTRAHWTPDMMASVGMRPQGQVIGAGGYRPSGGRGMGYWGNDVFKNGGRMNRYGWGQDMLNTAKNIVGGQQRQAQRFGQNVQNVTGSSVRQNLATAANPITGGPAGNVSNMLQNTGAAQNNPWLMAGAQATNPVTGMFQADKTLTGNNLFDRVGNAAGNMNMPNIGNLGANMGSGPGLPNVPDGSNFQLPGGGNLPSAMTPTSMAANYIQENGMPQPGQGLAGNMIPGMSNGTSPSGQTIPMTPGMSMLSQQMGGEGAGLPGMTTGTSPSGQNIPMTPGMSAITGGQLPGMTTGTSPSGQNIPMSPLMQTALQFSPTHQILSGMQGQQGGDTTPTPEPTPEPTPDGGGTQGTDWDAYWQSYYNNNPGYGYMGPQYNPWMYNNPSYGGGWGNMYGGGGYGGYPQQAYMMNYYKNGGVLGGSKKKIPARVNDTMARMFADKELEQGEAIYADASKGIQKPILTNPTNNYKETSSMVSQVNNAKPHVPYTESNDKISGAPAVGGEGSIAFSTRLKVPKDVLEEANLLLSKGAKKLV
jgi:hypothetical protein